MGIQSDRDLVRKGFSPPTVLLYYYYYFGRHVFGALCITGEVPQPGGRDNNLYLFRSVVRYLQLKAVIIISSSTICSYVSEKS